LQTSVVLSTQSGKTSVVLVVVGNGEVLVVDVLLDVAVLNVVVLDVVVLVVVVVELTQLGPLPGAGHASQQLLQAPTVPCFAVQCATAFSILHFVPLGVVTQHVTEPAGFPHVEWDAHLFTRPAQLLFARTVFACCATQLT
jgi:hypothetical protein